MNTTAIASTLSYYLLPVVSNGLDLMFSTRTKTITTMAFIVIGVGAWDFAKALGAAKDLTKQRSLNILSSTPLVLARLAVWKVGAINKEHYGLPLIHHAIIYKNLESIKFYYTLGANVNARDRKHDTPLHRAVRDNRPDLIKLLKELGAEFNAKNRKGNTPLHQAIKYNRPNLVRLLLELGAVFFVKNRNLAFKINKINLLKLLKKLEERLCDNDDTGVTSLHRDIEMYKRDSVILIEALGYDMRTSANFALAVTDDRHYLPWLLRPGVVGVKGTNLLKKLPIQAIERNMPNLLRLLIVLGVNPKFVDTKGGFLHHAIKYNRPNLVRLLLELGANLNATNLCSQTPLLLAFDLKRLDIVHLLLKEPSCDVNAMDFLGRTILHYAVKDEMIDLIKILVDLGATVDDDGCQGATLLRLAIELGNLALFALLIGLGANVNGRDGHRPTLLQGAVDDDNHALVKLLMEAGANAYVPDPDGVTPMSRTVDPKLIKLLQPFSTTSAGIF